MAELRVERKRPKVWLWIVLLLLVALLVWAIVELFGGGDPAAVIEDNPIGAQLDTGAATEQIPPFVHRQVGGVALG